MYENLDEVKTAEENSRVAAMADREKYFPFFEAAEKYIASRGMIVGGEIATLMLLGHPLGIENYKYELYTERVNADARGLADALYAVDPEGLGHYTNVRTVLSREEMIISVDERDLFHVKALAVHRGAKAADILVPSERPGYFGGKALKCMGPEIQLMSVYADLYDPSKADAWEHLLRTEQVLRESLIPEFEKKTAKAIEGGAEKASAVKFMGAVFDDFVSRTGHVLVGDYADRIARGEAPNAREDRLQIVTANSLKAEGEELRKIADRHGFTIQSTTNEPKIPTDPRIRKLTMYIVRQGGRRDPFIDVFNSGEYEVIPYLNAKRHKIGSYYTRLRFRLIDIWTLQLLFRMGAISSEYAKTVTASATKKFSKTAADYVRTLKDVEAALAKSTAKSEKVSPIEKIFPTEYVGLREDFMLYRKRHRFEAVKMGKRSFYPPYYPAKNQENRDPV